MLRGLPDYTVACQMERDLHGLKQGLTVSQTTSILQSKHGRSACALASATATVDDDDGVKDTRDCAQRPQMDARPTRRQSAFLISDIDHRTTCNLLLHHHLPRVILSRNP